MLSYQFIIGFAGLPAQQNALVEAVSKSNLTLPAEFVRAMGLDPQLLRPPEEAPAEPPVPFTSLEEIDRAIERRLAAWDLGRLARQAVEDHIDRVRGRV